MADFRSCTNYRPHSTLNPMLRTALPHHAHNRGARCTDDRWYHRYAVRKHTRTGWAGRSETGYFFRTALPTLFPTLSAYQVTAAAFLRISLSLVSSVIPRFNMVFSARSPSDDGPDRSLDCDAPCTSGSDSAPFAMDSEAKSPTLQMDPLWSDNSFLPHEAIGTLDTEVEHALTDCSRVEF